MITESSSKKHTKYCCELCDYSTSKKCNMTKHITTLKHKKRENDNKSSHICNVCGKSYKFHSGLSRHKQKCKDTVITNQYINEKFEYLMNQNNALHDKISELNDKSASTIINNKMTINLYLNEFCSSAINLSDFINKINISGCDLKYTIDNGYVKGINNLFRKNLETLKPFERPIYCTDKKRLRFYVKEHDEWFRDNNNIEKSIDKITIKHIQKIKEWETDNPAWNKSTELTEQYLKMIQEIAVSNFDKEKNIESIIKNLSNNTEIKEIM